MNAELFSFTTRCLKNKQKNANLCICSLSPDRLRGQVPCKDGVVVDFLSSVLHDCAVIVGTLSSVSRDCVVVVGTLSSLLHVSVVVVGTLPQTIQRCARSSGTRIFVNIVRAPARYEMKRTLG